MSFLSALRQPRFAPFLRLACAALFACPVPGQPPASARPVSAYGLLWLDIDSSNADIALDGLYVDQNVWLISIPPGDHEIRIRKSGFRDYESRFGILAGQNLHLDVHLESIPDSLSRPPI